MTSQRLQRLTTSDTAVHQRVLAPLVAGALLLLLVLYASSWTRTMLDQGDRFLLDQFHARSHKTPARDDIVILGIDDASQKLDGLWEDEIAASPALVEMKKAWQWRRRVWALVLDRLFEAGASHVFLDLTFKRPSHDPEDDRLLREALERHQGKVILGGKWEIENAAGTAGGAAATENIPLMEPTKEVAGEGFRQSGTFGLLNFFPDGNTDSKIRRANYWISVNQLIRAGLSGGQIDPTEKPLPSVAMLLGRKLDPAATAAAGEVERLRFCELGAYPPLSIHQIFVPDLWTSNFAGGAVFKDKVVMVGATASDLQDFQDAIPGRMEGVRLHAHALTALLAGAFIREVPAWWPWLNVVAGAVVAWLLVTFARHPLGSLGALLLLTIGAYGGCYLLFDRRNLEASPLAFILGLDLCGIAGLAGNYLMQRREQQRLFRFLARYTSPEQAAAMMQDRAGVMTALGGTVRTVTVLFSDVRGFTSMSENKTAVEIVTQLNEYLSKMVARVVDRTGIVDKFIGDAVMAVWGGMRHLQSEDAFRDDAQRAVRSALEMRKSLEELNAAWRAQGVEELKFGIGIHQGPVVVGNIGSESPYEKMDITVIGDSVNTASRLEGLTKQYGVDLLVSDAVRRHLGEEFICRTADLVRPKGKLVPLEVFAVVGLAGEVEVKGLGAFEDGVRLYRAGSFTEAKAAFHQAESGGLADELTAEYLDRCGALLAHPPETWDGVYTATKK